MARLLAIDTSTEQLALAVQNGGRSRTLLEEGGARASARLLPAALALLRELGLAPADLEAIAFGRGPGAFTGLRTACAVAQGLSLGSGAPLLAIDSLMIVAEDALALLVDEQSATASALVTMPLWVAIDARMDEVYAAAYLHVDGRWQVQVAPALWALDALAQRWRAEPPRCVAGNAPALFGARLPLAAGTRILVQQQDRAAALLRLAQQAWQDGLAMDAADALPLYLRDRVALTTAEREAARAGEQA